MSRKAIREELASLLTATGSFNRVFSYPPTDIKQTDKGVAVYSNGSQTDIITASMTNDIHKFNIDVYVRRENTVDSEDSFDNLYTVVRNVLNTAATTGNDNWSALYVNQYSDSLFAVVSGKPYRVERFRVLVKETLT